MPSTFYFGPNMRAFVQNQLSSGRYRDDSEVVQSALHLLEEHDNRRAQLELAIKRGLSDIDAGRVYNADNVFDELEMRYEQQAQ